MKSTKAKIQFIDKIAAEIEKKKLKTPINLANNNLTKSFVKKSKIGDKDKQSYAENIMMTKNEELMQLRLSIFDIASKFS
jgi:hypothetical protein